MFQTATATAHPLRKLLRTHRADCHCRPRPAGAESSVWKTEKAADKRVTRCPSGIRLDWSGNRTGKTQIDADRRGRSIYPVERVDCRSPVSLYASKRSLRAKYFRIPWSNFPEVGGSGTVIQSDVQQPADFTGGSAGRKPATRPL
jgi:hypothetical protein